MLGGELIKQRIARAGKGKSGGYRTVIAFRTETRSIFLYGFAKSERDNIDDADLVDLRAAGKAALGLSETGVAIALGNGELWEIDCNEKEVPQ